MALRAAPTREIEHGELRKRLRWLEVRAKLVDPQIAGYGGHIQRRTADGLFVEFRSAQDAVRCAIELQRDIAAVNAAESDLPTIDLRVAIAPAGAESEAQGEHGFSDFFAARMDAHRKHGWMLRASMKGRDL